MISEYNTKIAKYTLRGNEFIATHIDESCRQLIILKLTMVTMNVTEDMKLGRILLNCLRE